MKKSFRRTTVFLSISVAVIPALILSVFTINRLSEQVEQRSINEFKLKAENAGRQLSFEITGVADRLSAVARRRRIGSTQVVNLFTESSS